MSAPSWSDLERRERTPPPNSEQWAKLHELCALVFTSPSGRELMAALRKVTIEARARSGATEAELREMEARRALVFDLESWRDKGLAAMEQKAKPPA